MTHNIIIAYDLSGVTRSLDPNVKDRYQLIDEWITRNYPSNKKVLNTTFYIKNTVKSPRDIINAMYTAKLFTDKDKVFASKSVDAEYVINTTYQTL